MTQDTLYYVGFCTRCGTGPLGIRICGGCQRPWIVCDECDAVWAQPDCRGEPLTLAEPLMPCPQCQASLQRTPSHWATAEDLVRIGWRGDVVGQGKPLTAHPTEDDSASRTDGDSKAPDDSDSASDDSANG